MLALTPLPLQTAGERALFAELTRWDTGGASGRPSSPPSRSSTARCSGGSPTPSCSSPRAWPSSGSSRSSASPASSPRRPRAPGRSAPTAARARCCSSPGGGSTPLDGLMRAGMDAAVRLRRAGLEPGRIARLTVLVGDVTGLVPADGDLGEGDHVGLLEPRSLLLGIARSTRYAGVDNPRLWTTADVRAALEALGLPGRGPVGGGAQRRGVPLLALRAAPPGAAPRPRR